MYANQDLEGVHYDPEKTQNYSVLKYLENSPKIQYIGAI